MHRWCSGFPSLYFPENLLARSHSWEQMVFLQIPQVAGSLAGTNTWPESSCPGIFKKVQKRRVGILLGFCFLAFFELAPFCLSASLNPVHSFQLVVGTCLPGAASDLTVCILGCGRTLSW